MEQYEPPERYWTRTAMISLAARLRVRYGDDMQDWPWAVAESERLDEYLTLYDALTDDDERFTLMDVMLQAVEEQASLPHVVQGWEELRHRIRQRPALHAWQLWYWSLWNTEMTGAFRITPYTQELWQELYQPTAARLSYDPDNRVKPLQLLYAASESYLAARYFRPLCSKSNYCPCPSCARPACCCAASPPPMRPPSCACAPSQR